MQIKKAFFKLLPYKFIKPIRDVLYPEKINILEDRLSSFVSTYYQELASPELGQRGEFKNAEFKVFSKHGCDGMLLHIFSKIGATDHKFVEMGIENGRECNTANLSLNLGWSGLLLDADKDFVESAQKYYDSNLEGNSNQVKVAQSFVTAENFDETLKLNNIKGEIDLLSIDIDSNDYFIWKHTTEINPRVVIVEYNAAFGLRSVTVKYDPNFHYQAKNNHRLYFGASLSALAKLAKEKGYILVACDKHGHDAYFVRKDVAEGKFVELTPKEAFYENPYTIENIGTLDEQFEMIKDLEYEEI